MMSEVQTLNPGLFRLHRIFYVAYFAFFGISVLFGVLGFVLKPQAFHVHLVWVAGVVLLPGGVFHWYAAKGARSGKRDRVMTLIFAASALFAFPIGTVIAIHIFTKTGKQWQSEAVPA